MGQDEPMKETSRVVENFKTSIFTQITSLATKKNAFNLSQGLPDFDGPHWVQKLACDAITNNKNQSSPAHGLLTLRQAISDNYKKYHNLNYCPEQEITICNGATEAIYSTIMALVNPGDEVIVVEPFFDTYIPGIELAGGKAVTVTLHAPHFKFDPKELAQAFNDKTKLIILNTPHNPSGRILDASELELIADLTHQHDCYVISDEVYEFLTYDGKKHIPPASIKNLHARTITCSSTGKTFGFTGWRIGWAAAPKNISHVIRMVHQNNTFSAPRPLQEAMAIALTRLDGHIPAFTEIYQAKRDLLFVGLQDAGFNPIKPESTYFIMAPIDHLTSLNDVDFAMELIEKAGVATIPPSAFYNKSSDGSRFLRFCFAKEDKTLKNAIKNLHQYLG